MNGHTTGPVEGLTGRAAGVFARLLAKHGRNGGYAHLGPGLRLEIFAGIKAMRAAGLTAEAMTAGKGNSEVEITGLDSE